ncbi:class B sortase [Butyrivibrio sp. VCB2006]|uniref:class B sortase n=1 Tax=Butyrivibrio sp. VCB2006 TaxID=1280679 RepID=UPI000404D9A9|nr:class B sortase [Butyrivibrio sp. VCB2006]
MKKRVVSILIAGVLFFSNIGVTSFAANSSANDASSASSSEASTEAGAGSSLGDPGEQVNNDANGVEEAGYFKITDFADLPEDISNQKIRVGGSLEDLELPDTLEVIVEPDPEHDERIERGLEKERERLMRERLERLREELEAEQAGESASEDSSEEDDAASSASSEEEDGDKLFFFGDDEAITDDSGELSEEAEAEEEAIEDTTTIEDESNPTTESTVDNSTEADTQESSDVIIIPTEDATVNELNESTDGSSESASEASSEQGLVSWLKHTFRNAAVAYAADVEEKTQLDENANVQLISDVEWIMEADYNYGEEEFNPDTEGKIYLFTPVLKIPDTYYIEDELPIITVFVTDDYYAFDEETVVDDVKIRVRADKGVFPEGSRVTAKKLVEEDEQKVKELVDEQIDTENIVKEYSFDITIKDRDNNEVQPDTEKGRVVVSFEAAEVADEALEAEVYHIIDESKDDKEQEPVEAVALGSERSKERVLTIYDENSVLKAEKLEAEVVEFEDVKVLEAETTGFSTYKVIFKIVEKIDDTVYEYKYEVTTSTVIPVKDILGNAVDPGQNEEDTSDDTPLYLPDNYKIKKVTLGNGKNSNEYLYVGNLCATTNSNQVVPEDDPSTGMYKESEDGTGEWFVIVKQPYAYDAKNPQTLLVTFENTGLDPISISLTSCEEYSSAESDNYGYPTASMLSNKGFMLYMPTVDYNEESGKLHPIMYQWQHCTDNKNFKDIDLANTKSFGSATVGEWYRCLVNGTPSESVQVVTARNDGKKRTWTDCHDSDQRYVSNGLMAYTMYGRNKIDVVGEFSSGGKKYMLQSTIGGGGWTTYPKESEDQELVYRDDIFFYFTESKSLVVDTFLKAGTNKFAITANAQIGDHEKNTAIATEADEYELERLAIVGAKNQDAIQTAINVGTGNSIPSLLVIPKTNTGLKYYIGKTNSQEPYKTREKTIVEDTKPGTSISWESSSLTEVEVEFKLAGAAANKILPAVSKRATSNTYSTGNLKSIKLSGSELDSYAKKLGEPTEEILIEMKNAAASSTDKTAISNILPTYAKTSGTTSSTTTSSSTTSSASSSNSSNSTKYTADYYGVTFTYKKDSKTVTDQDGFYKDKAELPIVLTEEISYDFKEKEDIRVFRCHDGEAKELSSDNPGGDGTYKLDQEAGKIYIYASNFSSFGVAYKPETYYTVTFNDGTNTWTVKVKAGEKVAAPEGTPTKEGYTFMGWYLKGASTTSTTSSTTSSSSTSKSTSTTTSNATPYNFDTPVNSNITLTAGFTAIKDDTDTSKKDAASTGASDEEGDVNGARAPHTGDTLPPVWLWVLVLVGGIVAFSCNLYARAKEGKVKFSKNKTVRKVTRFFLLIGLVIVTVTKFCARKAVENKRQVALAISGMVVLVAGGALIATSIAYHRSEKVYENANKVFVKDTQEIPLSSSPTEVVNEENSWWNEASVEMATLSEEYPDVVGWIYFENEDISYPIMFSGDNTKYLDTAYTGEKARAGAIFLDGESTPDFSDPHSLIYGHNMRDLTMFGKLRYYKTDASYYDEHQYFQVFTRDGVYRYQIFAYEEVPDSHDVFWVYGKNPEGMWEMLQDIEGGSYRKTGIEATESDHVITLATCTSKEDRRLIVSALRTDEHDFDYVASSN